MYKNILIPIDLGSDESWKHALPTAIELCKLYNASLRLLLVVPDFGMTIVGQFFPDDFERNALSKAEEQLHAFREEHVPDDIDCSIAIAHGHIPEEILRVQKETSSDLIVMQSTKREAHELMIRPNATTVMRHAPCSVMVVRD